MSVMRFLLPTPTAVARGEGFQLRFSVCLSVFQRDISKTDAVRITKLGIEMFHVESWKPFYFGIKGQRSRSLVTKTLPA